MSQTFQIDNKALYQKIAQQLGISALQVASFVQMYDDGQTVPFIARYRKDKTGGLDDVMLRALEKTLNFERDLEARRLKIKTQLATQNALSDELIARIDAAQAKLELEEIYAPYRPKRRSLATKATLAGLKPFAERILAGEPVDILTQYQPVDTVTEGAEVLEVDYSTQELQLQGVQAIILEEWATNLVLLERLRLGFAQGAALKSTLVGEEKREVGEKFKDYFDHSESFARLSHHRLLAMLRGRQQNVLSLKVTGEDEPFITAIAQHFDIDSKAASVFLAECAKALWLQKWRPQIEHRLLTERRLKAESDAIGVFANNLKHLLMAAPVGEAVILGVDPGIRHGVKMAVIDSTGTPLVAQTVYPFAPDNKTQEAKQTIKELIANHQVRFVAIGNGTASRETERLIKEVIKQENLEATAVVISESGASVYSASELASAELAQLDVSLRGAVSIARRLQDPLSELVKIAPKAIGVGQYQHDVNQSELEQSLQATTEDCVNAIGVDVNTASPAILSYVAGLNKNVAEQIVSYRQTHGAFKNREQLKAVPRLGNKTFEQAAGFLRIKSGEEPLDATGVHPESYEALYTLLAQHQIPVAEAIGNPDTTQRLRQDLESLSMLDNALNELGKARHDPRGTFRTVKFKEGVTSLDDLSLGMELQGVVTNVTNFGCFVDVGVHQDGLVHISEMAEGFVANPSDIVKPADIVSVRVVSLDTQRGRVGFSMKKPKAEDNQAKAKPTKARDGMVSAKAERPKATKKPAPKPPAKPVKQAPTKIGSFGALLQEALK